MCTHHTLHTTHPPCGEDEPRVDFSTFLAEVAEIIKRSLRWAWCGGLPWDIKTLDIVRLPGMTNQDQEWQALVVVPITRISRCPASTGRLLPALEGRLGPTAKPLIREEQGKRCPACGTVARPFTSEWTPGASWELLVPSTCTMWAFKVKHCRNVAYRDRNYKTFSPLYAKLKVVFTFSGESRKKFFRGCASMLG